MCACMHVYMHVCMHVREASLPLTFAQLAKVERHLHVACAPVAIDLAAHVKRLLQIGCGVVGLACGMCMYAYMCVCLVPSASCR